MANKPKGYGMTREISERLDAKYDDDKEDEIVSWICSCTGLTKPSKGRESFAAWLKDGSVLHKLVESFNILPKMYELKPTANVKLAAMRGFKEQENIAEFLKVAADVLKCKPVDLFQTVDLWEAKNLSQVQTCLIKVSGGASKLNANIENIGAKIADKNERHFTEEQQRQGRNVSSLQMGTNQVASQQGMTSYGAPRQIV